MKKGSKFGRQVFCALSFAVVWAAASSAMAEDLYFCPNADGKGATNWKDSSSNHGWYIGKSNWTARSSAAGRTVAPTRPRATSRSAGTARTGSPAAAACAWAACPTARRSFSARVGRWMPI